MKFGVLPYVVSVPVFAMVTAVDVTRTNIFSIEDLSFLQVTFVHYIRYWYFLCVGMEFCVLYVVSVPVFATVTAVDVTRTNIFSHLVTILDDSEFYESDEPFALYEYALLGTFVNQFLYKAIWSGALLGKY
jgi:hypothetical protein